MMCTDMNQDMNQNVEVNEIIRIQVKNNPYEFAKNYGNNISLLHSLSALDNEKKCCPLFLQIDGIDYIKYQDLNNNHTTAQYFCLNNIHDHIVVKRNISKQQIAIFEKFNEIHINGMCPTQICYQDFVKLIQPKLVPFKLYLQQNQFIDYDIFKRWKRNITITVQEIHQMKIICRSITINNLFLDSSSSFIFLGKLNKAVHTDYEPPFSIVDDLKQVDKLFQTIYETNVNK